MPMAPVCPSCRRMMNHKVSEQRQEKGSWVVYECINNGCPNYVRSNFQNRLREKVFESR